MGVGMHFYCRNHIKEFNGLISSVISVAFINFWESEDLKDRY